MQVDIVPACQMCVCTKRHVLSKVPTTKNYKNACFTPRVRSSLLALRRSPLSRSTKKPTDGDAWETESHGEQPEVSEAIDYSMDVFGEMDVSTGGMTPNASPDPSPPPKGSASVKVEPSLPLEEEAEPGSPPKEEAEPSSPPKEEAEPSSPPKEEAGPSPPPKRPRGRPPKRRILSMSPTGRPATPSGARVNGESWSSRRASAAVVKLEPEDSGEDYLSTPTHPKKKKRANRKWGNSRGRADGKLGGGGGGAGPAVVGAVSSPAAAAVAVTLQPETDDVEGLLFVSFTSQVKHPRRLLSGLRSHPDIGLYLCGP